MEKKYKEKQLIAFESLEATSEAFDKVNIACFYYEENCTDKGTLSYKESYEILKRLEYSIIKEGMFSPNENIKEIHTENMK